MALVQVQAKEKREDRITQKLQTFEGPPLCTHRGVRKRSTQQTGPAEAMAEPPFDLVQPRIRFPVFRVSSQGHEITPLRLKVFAFERAEVDDKADGDQHREETNSEGSYLPRLGIIF
jgi:hypothetical protein